MEAHHPNASSRERKPRLMISKMELENFKSYAGVQAIGPFHKCFSSIVGPNGSGKSNVIDALLFVFGARAKQLRLNKVSELVHKSSLFPSLDFARVAIYFQLIVDDESSDENFEVVPGSEFCVARVAYANNTSKYTIDNRTSSFTEVGTLLRSHGVDLDNNRFLILQGEVEQIAMMKPKGVNEHEEGLLEYLEDIIGSNQFVPQIEEASKALDAVNEQRVEKVHRLKVAEKERDNLHGSKLEAEQFLDKEKQIRHKKNLLYQIYLYIHARNMAEVSTKLEGINAKLVQERSKLVEGEDRLKATEKEYDLVKAEHSALQAELVKASSQHDSFERKEVKLQEDLKHTKGHWKKQQANVVKEEKKLVDVQRDMDALAQHIAKTEQVLADFAQKRTVAEEELSVHMKAVNQQAQPIRVQLEAKQQALALAEKAAGGLCTERELIQNQIALLHGRQEQVQQDILAVESKLQQAAQEREKQLQQRQALVSQQQPNLQQSLAQLEQQREQCKREQEKVQQQLLALIAQLEHNKESLQRSKSLKSSNKTLQSIFQAARCGSLASSKIVGRLGDLAAIPAAYDVAMNTACKYLNYVVVQSTEDAQAVIAYLREHQLGRASFIVLDQMDKYAKKMVAPCPAVAKTSSTTKRLFDLLEDVHSEDVRAAFYMALGNTFVADDLETAMAVAYQNPKAPQRVVTVAGQLIDVSGAMSGGGKEVKKGDMRLVVEGKAHSSTAASRAAGKASKDALGGEANVTEEMIQRQEQQLVEVQEQASTLQGQVQSIEQQIKQLQAQLKQVAHEIQKLDISLQHLEQQQLELAKRLETLRGQRGLTADEQREEQRLAKQVEQLDLQIAQASPNLKSLQEEVNSLQRSILAVGGLEASKLTNRIDSLSAQIDQLSSSLTTKRVEHANLTKTLQKGQASLEKSRAEMEKHSQRLQALETEQAEMTQDARTIVDLIEDYKRKQTSLEGSLAEKQAAYHRLKEEVSRGKALEVDLVMEGERLNNELKEERGSQTHYQKELQTVRKQHVAEQKEWKDVVAKAVPEAENTSMDVEGESWETLPDVAEEELAVADVDQIKKDINVLEAERNKLKGNVNMNALLDYLRKDALYRSRLSELEAITAQRASLLENLETLRSNRLTHFMQGFTSISLYLKEMYQMLTLGGDAELELIDSLDPFSEGIVFSVRPVKKSWKSILNLSGGEKTLASLALVFALHYYKPTPLYVMDEIDAALDFKNVSIVANYIKERTKNAQFVIISLRNNMFELADRLVGIYKTNDHTKSITISPKLFAVPGMASSVPTASAAHSSETNSAMAKDSSASIGRRVPLSDTTNKIY